MTRVWEPPGGALSAPLPSRERAHLESERLLRAGRPASAISQSNQKLLGLGIINFALCLRKSIHAQLPSWSPSVTRGPPNLAPTPQIVDRLARADVNFLPHHHALLKKSNYTSPSLLPSLELFEEPFLDLSCLPVIANRGASGIACLSTASSLRPAGPDVTQDCRSVSFFRYLDKTFYPPGLGPPDLV